MSNQDRHGTPPHIAAIGTLAESVSEITGLGRSRAWCVAQMLDTRIRFGHAVETEPERGEGVGAIDAVQAAYGTSTDAYAMGMFLSELEAADIWHQEVLAPLLRRSRE